MSPKSNEYPAADRDFSGVRMRASAAGKYPGDTGDEGGFAL
jgi:hypothetical protein